MTPEHSPSGLATAQLIFEILRLHGRLMARGDALMADIGLTSARWQMLGAVAFATGPQTASDLARTMGVARQSAQRVLNDLEALGLVAPRPNPAHKRAPLIVLTERGQAAHRAAEALRVPWTEEVARRLGDHDAAAARDTLAALRRAL